MRRAGVNPECSCSSPPAKPTGKKVAAAVALTRRISVISGGPRDQEDHHHGEASGGDQIDDSPRCRIRLRSADRESGGV